MVISKIVSLPWGLGKVGKETLSIEGHFGPSFGATYTIEVDGRRYVCSSGRSKLAKSYPIPILYDPEDPSRCRDKDVGDSIGEYEQAVLGFIISVFLFGLSTVLWRVSHQQFIVIEEFDSKIYGLSNMLWRVSHPKFNIIKDGDYKKRRWRKVALAADVIYYSFIVLINYSGIRFLISIFSERL